MNGTATWTPDGMNHAVLADENGAEIVDSGLVLEAAGIEVAGFVHPPLASKDGRYLAFIADDGTDWRTVVLYDVEQRDFLQERLPTFPTGPVWREDGTLGIIIDTMPRSLREQNPPLHSEMGQWSAHKPGEPVSRAVALETIPQEVALSSEKVGPEIIGVFGGRTYSRISTPLTNVPFVMDSDGQLIGNVGPNRVPEDVAMHSQWLAIQLQADMVDVIDIIDLDTSETWTFDPLEHGLPAGALRNLAFQGGELTVVYVPPLGVPQRYSIDPGARAAHVVGSEAELPEDVRVEILHFPGPDGPLPMKLISNGSRPSGLPGPVLMSVYGGFQIDTSDGGLSPVEQLFVEQGGTVAVPALRGGMESLQGLGGQPEDTIIDAVAAASALIEQGRARPGADIVISGSSNGAYTAALAGLERPDLWAGVISIAGPHDLLSFEQYSFGPGWRSEYGTASEASDAHGSVPALPMGQPHFSNFQRERPPIIGRSPYHRALTATDTPAMLIITGGRDSRVDRSHSNKFAAAAQAIEAGRGPVLFASLPTAGHSFVGADDRLRLDQLIFGFAADATNLEQP
ncbi:MAG: prolyl oligopeptidase family serine peptidase [Myxococcota bacterium]